VYVIQTVPMGADGTPTQWNYGTPSGFPAQATGMWTASTHLAWPPDPPTVQALTNPSGDQVVIRADGILHWMTAAGTGPGQLNTPVAAAVAPDGSVYVANLGNSDVVHLAPSGQVLGTFGGYGTTPGELLGADGIAVGPTGTVYVIDAGAQAVASYSATGRFLRAWGHWGSGPGLFNGPAALAVGPHGTVYVADSLNNRVEAFSPTGAFQGQVATPDPAALTVTGSGLLDVTDGLSGQTSTVAFPRTLTLLAAPADATAVATGPTGA
jgi:sugar lactone lactonase YvrE